MGTEKGIFKYLNEGRYFSIISPSTISSGSFEIIKGDWPNRITDKGFSPVLNPNAIRSASTARCDF